MRKKEERQRERERENRRKTEGRTHTQHTEHRHTESSREPLSPAKRLRVGPSNSASTTESPDRGRRGRGLTAANQSKLQAHTLSLSSKHTHAPNEVLLGDRCVAGAHVSGRETRGARGKRDSVARERVTIATKDTKNNNFFSLLLSPLSLSPSLPPSSVYVHACHTFHL